MASTNKTTNYELSQFVGSDKPAWLSDYNQDMSKIDTAIKGAANAASSADGKATANTSAIGDLTNLTTTSKTNVVSAINEVKTDAGTAQNTANSATAQATANANAISALKDYLSLSTAINLTWTLSGGGTLYANDVKIMKNNTNSLMKLYGQLVIDSVNGTGTITATSSDTGLRPDEDITINGAAMDRTNRSDGHFLSALISYTIKTNGSIVVTFNRATNINSKYIFFLATLIFVEDFGDVAPEE